MKLDLTNVASYDYDLPPGQIAQYPQSPRDESRLLILHRATGKIEHRKFRDLPEYLDSKDLLVANDTKVMRARLVGNRLLSKDSEEPVLGGKIEMLLLERRTDLETGGGFYWEGAFHSSRKQIPGFRFSIPKRSGGTLIGEIVKGSRDSPSGTIVAKFLEDPLASDAGELPLPHYIEKPTGDEEANYQTVYAKELGSAAAPTAGLHFTHSVLDDLRSKGVEFTTVTLHVGLGTFRPVKTESILDHVMHAERYSVEEPVAQKITNHRKSGGRIVCVGTTSVRTLESIYDPLKKTYAPGSGGTSIFIYPGSKEPVSFDRLITNFHLPRSTLLMLVSAFAGRDLTLLAYREAVEKGYRFFSYGDAMLIL
ncbi:MAG: tRNA preQ1(34) S-adenosylmethionine ribosyltransferase-isomerase QueA [Cryobacterium sp.]|nr:tRNA preQ1(34) S-adenosylmethionine ribosyltransferase-isomerase QueA [Oligoflexia bacterium]